ncbi:MAG TPA: hypothetical protein VJN67_00790 [Stellaceae bacterium]|nr:hypothetical protein [Stellaceae bacterium]
MTTSAVVGWALAPILIAITFWLRRRRRAQPRRPAGSVPQRPARTAAPKPSEVLIYIEADGSARELSDAEKTYVDTDFLPFDGARPHIKSSYEQRNGWGEIKGFLHRKELPPNMPVNPAPLSSPSTNTPEAVAAEIGGLIRKHHSE